MKTKLLVLALLALGISGCESQTTAEISSAEEKASYAIGYEQSKELKELDIQLSAGAYFQGIKDGQSGNDGLLDEEQRQAAVLNLKKLIQEKAMEKAKKQMEGAAEESSVFLKDNATKEGVIIEPNGIQYKVVASGKGKSPKASDTVKVHYRGTLTDGKEFDSSYKRNEPAQFPLQGVIPGWTYILQKMKTGDKWTVYLPGDLAYGSNGVPGMIPPNSTLIFDIELLEIL